MNDQVLTRLPAAALERHVAFLGTSDAGKTYAAKGEVEQLLGAGRRVCIIDPKGVWYGLRLSPDGRSPSPFQLAVFGGHHGDVPLARSKGRRLAELVAGNDFSCVIDTRLLSVGARTELFADFAEALAELNTRPLHLVIDEAHLFAPQGRVFDVQSGRMLSAANELVSGGRSQGLRCMLLSQRPAKLHKDALSQVLALVAMLNVAPQDRAAVGTWIKEQADAKLGREIMESLPGLPTGQGWVWAPRLGVLEKIEFGPITTFDSSATPDHDDIAAGPVKLHAIDQALLEAFVADDAVTQQPGDRTVTRTPKKAAPGFTQADLDAAEARGYARGLSEGERKEWSRQLNAQIAENQARLDRLLQELGDERAEREALRPAPAESPAPAHPVKIRRETAKSAGGAGEAAAAKLIIAIERYPVRGLSWPEACIVARMLHGNGYFYGGRKAALASGRITERDGRVYPQGGEFPVAPLTRAEIIALWSDLKAPAPAMLKAIAPNVVTTTEVLAEATGLKPGNGFWYGGLAALRKAGLIEQDGQVVRLTTLLREANP